MEKEDNVYLVETLCLKMPTKKPRTTVTFDFDDYEELQTWAESEFRSVPQMIHAIVKKALLERKVNGKSSNSSTKSKEVS